MSLSKSHVSVVIPAYNAAITLRETLASALEQTLEPDEVIVVDDGSTDATAAIAASCGATVVRQQNVGVSAARNSGVLAAGGECVAFLDADDLWHPEKLARQIRFMDDSPEVGLSFTDFYEANSVGKRSQSPSITARPNYREMTKQPAGDGRYICDQDAICNRFPRWSFIQPSTVVVRKRLFEEVGGFDTTLSLAEDFDFFCRLFPFTEVGVIECRLATYRRHEGQASAKSASSLLRSELELAIAASLGTKPYHAVTNAYFRDELPSIATRIAWCLFRMGSYADAAFVWRILMDIEPSLKHRALYAISRGGAVPIGSKAIRISRAAGHALKMRARLTRRSHRTSNGARSEPGARLR